MQTSDPNKTAVYLDNLEAHGMNAISYFPKELKYFQDKLDEAETATKFYFDDTKEGLDQFTCQNTCQ